MLRALSTIKLPAGPSGSSFKALGLRIGIQELQRCSLGYDIEALIILDN